MWALVQELAAGQEQHTINATVREGEHAKFTALMFACKFGHECAARILIQHAARTDLTCSHGRTAHGIAHENGRDTICALFAHISE